MRPLCQRHPTAPPVAAALFSTFPPSSPASFRFRLLQTCKPAARDPRVGCLTRSPPLRRPAAASSSAAAAAAATTAASAATPRRTVPVGRRRPPELRDTPPGAHSPDVVWLRLSDSAHYHVVDLAGGKCSVIRSCISGAAAWSTLNCWTLNGCLAAPRPLSPRTWASETVSRVTIRYSNRAATRLFGSFDRIAERQSDDTVLLSRGLLWRTEARTTTWAREIVKPRGPLAGSPAQATPPPVPPG